MLLILNSAFFLSKFCVDECTSNCKTDIFRRITRLVLASVRSGIREFQRRKSDHDFWVWSCFCCQILAGWFDWGLAVCNQQLSGRIAGWTTVQIKCGIDRSYQLVGVEFRKRAHLYYKQGGKNDLEYKGLSFSIHKNTFLLSFFDLK